ncbi:ribonuclease P protein component [Mesomycoplasma hyorhinis]|uniref:ribonuclease P protein component n=1 Tax=Mesomycoplasma hyorhinis TaxID=2100 RepID=UPI001C03D50C
MLKFKKVRKNWQFQNIINFKQQIVNKELILYYKEFFQFELGISIPKKFVNAVKRNYYKRQIKIIIQNYLKNKKEFNVKFQIILITRKSFLNLDFKTKEIKIKNILNELENIWNKRK